MARVHRKKVIPIFTIFVRVAFFVDVALNLILSDKTTDRFGLCFWNLVCCGIWFYAFLGSLGFIKTIASEDEDGTVIYATPFPVLPWGIIRMIEVGFMLLLRKSIFCIDNFVTVLIADCIFVVFLLLDKSAYYYVSYGGRK